MSGPARLQVSALGKRFGGLVAVKNMSFELHAGEIVGLIGPNGSGKSTVMSLIMGIARPNSGTIMLDGVSITGWPTHRVARSGVSIVFQHSRPLQRQTVLENVKLAILPDSLLRLATEASVTERARAIAERVGLGGVLHRHPWTLPFADLRRMELAKAVARDPKVVLIDEPFAGLTAAEIHVLSDLIRTLRDEGRAVLLVDHSVKSVAALADRIIAMYLGERIAEGSADEVMQNETVRRVYIGGKIEAIERRHHAGSAHAANLLQLDAVEVFYGKAKALDRVDLRVQQDEFVSIVGLNGAGKTTLFNAISGLVPYRGAIRFAERDLRELTAAKIARTGVVHCPETRELFVHMSVRENLDLGGGHLSKRERERQLTWVFDLFPILEERQGQAARTLSGGEQQMLALGRALMLQPKLLILDEPTLGLAPVILSQISKAIERLRQKRSLTLLLGEQNITFALPHADRVYVLDHGRITWHGDPARFAAEMGTGYL
jgi:branched-chain amino acid transport system ATP-binding protein